MPRVGYEQSDRHKKEHLEKIKGEKNGNWKGGIYVDNPQYRQGWNRKWRKENPIQAQISDRKSKLKRRSLLIGSFTIGEWENLKQQYGFRCPSCLKIEPEIKLTIDHIIPVTKGGSSYIENIQPLCNSCNSKKHTKVIKFELTGKAR